MGTGEFKGVTTGALLWAAIVGAYGLTGMGLKLVIDTQRDQRTEFENARMQINQAITQAVTDRDRRFQEIERGAREGTEQRAEQLASLMHELQTRLDQLNQQQAEMRADIRNLQSIRDDLRTLVEKRK